MRVIEVVPYKNEWVELFQKEKEALKTILGENSKQIYHIGSTAIPGISAKPVIDIMVEVNRIEEVDRCNDEMKQLGYKAKGENGIVGRRFFQKGGDYRTHHVHIFESGNKEIQRHLAFRDYLIAHHNEAKKYSELKEKLANQFRFDPESYFAGKDAFIKEIDRKARMVIRKVSNEEAPIELLLEADPSVELVKNYLKTGECYIVEIDSETVGVYVLLPINSDTVELKNIAVSEDNQGKGIGKQLVLDSVHRAKQNGYKRIVVGTGNSSIGQLALYQKCGFRITGIEKDFFVKNYPGTINENGIQCVDMIRLSQEFK